MRIRSRFLTGASVLAVALTTTAALAACTSGSDDAIERPTTTTSPPTTSPPDTAGSGGPGESLRFIPFGDCDGFLAYVREQALQQVGPYGLNDPRAYSDAGGTVATTAAESAASSADEGTASAAPVAAETRDSSTTNTQEAGVDEGDLVENDGQRVYSVVDGRLRIVDIAAGAEIASVSLPQGQHQLLLDGSRLAVVTEQWNNDAETMVSMFDVTDPAAPTLLGRTHLEGTATAVRSSDGTARIVMSSSFGSRLPFVQPQFSVDDDEAEAENRRIIETSTPEDWLPRSYTEDAGGSATTPTTALDCSTVGHPTEQSGLGLVWVASLPMSGPEVTALGSAGVVSSSGVAYASASTLYVGTTRYEVIEGDGGFVPSEPEPPATAIHAFDLATDGPATYLASGTVPGMLLNQFSMSEHEGLLRVAVTEQDGGFGDTSESSVRVLQRDGDVLTEIGTVGGLGRTEQIYAVRFLGDLAYVVTFRQTDPLYVVDLRDPAAPVVAGELKVPGYSAYLHPISETLLLGVGQDATDEGRTLGTKLSLFDVTDPAAPAELATLDVGGSSEAEFTHHAFLWWPTPGAGGQGDVIIPVMDWARVDTVDGDSPSSPEAAAVVAGVAGGAISERGRITHQGRVGQSDDGGYPDPYLDQVERSLIVDGQLVTVSNRGVLVSDLASTADVTWVPFA